MTAGAMHPHDALEKGEEFAAGTAEAEAVTASSQLRPTISPEMKRRPLSTVLRISIAMVRGPTPPAAVGEVKVGGVKGESLRVGQCGKHRPRCNITSNMDHVRLCD